MPRIAWGSITISDIADGITPVLGEDYFDGESGDYVSYVFRLETGGVTPATPTNGSFDGTNEVTPTSPAAWTDDRTEPSISQVRWISSVRYRQSITYTNGVADAPTWARVGGWSTPVKDSLQGEKPVVATLTNNSHTVIADAAGTPTDLTGSGTKLVVWNGGTVLAHDVTELGTANGNWALDGAPVAVGVTIGTKAHDAYSLTYPDITAMTADVGSITFKVKGVGYNGVAFSGVEVVQSFSKARKGAVGDTGPQGLTASDIVGVVGQQWAFKNGADGWIAQNATLDTSGHGTVKITPTATDPRFQSASPLGIVGADSYALRIKARCTTTATTTLVFYYSTSDNTPHPFSGSYKKEVTVDWVANEYQYVVLDLRELTAGGTNWLDSTIDQIRVDFSDSNSLVFEVDGIVVGFFGAADQTDYDVTQQQADDARDEALVGLSNQINAGCSDFETLPVEDTSILGNSGMAEHTKVIAAGGRSGSQCAQVKNHITNGVGAGVYFEGGILGAYPMKTAPERRWLLTAWVKPVGWSDPTIQFHFKHRPSGGPDEHPNSTPTSYTAADGEWVQIVGVIDLIGKPSNEVTVRIYCPNMPLDKILHIDSLSVFDVTDAPHITETNYPKEFVKGVDFVNLTDPAIANTAVDSTFIKTKFGWTTAPADGADVTNYNDTSIANSEINDAHIKSQFGWTTAPADGADVTNYNDVSIANTAVDSTFIKTKFGWTTAPADGADVTNYNDTSIANSEINDAHIKSQFGWTTAPADGADVTNYNDVSIANSQVTKTFVGLGSVDNKSSATLKAEAIAAAKIDALLANDSQEWSDLQSRPTDTQLLNVNTTKTDVGLGSVDDKSSATLKAEAIAAAKIDALLANDSQEWSDLQSRPTDTQLLNVNTTKTDVGLGSVDDKSSATLKAEAIAAAKIDALLANDSQEWSDLQSRPTDTQLLNVNTTKTDVGLSSVDDKSSATLKAEAIAGSKLDNLLLNKSGAGVNFFNSNYTLPDTRAPLSKSVNATGSYIATPAYSNPSGGNMIRINATGTDAHVNLGSGSADYNTTVPVGLKWLVSFWVYAVSPQAINKQVQFYIRDSNGTYFVLTDTTVNQTSTWTKVSGIIDMTASTANKVIFRLDNDGGSGSNMVFDQIMVEPYIEGSADNPSEYAPPTQEGRFKSQRSIPLVSSIGISAAQNVNPVSSDVNGTYARIDITSHTVYDSEGSVTYNSGSITGAGVSYNTTYFIYCDDYAYAGGAVTYLNTTSLSTLVADSGRRYVGRTKTPLNSGAAPNPPEDGDCVYEEVWLTDSLQAKDAQVGDLIDVWDVGLSLSKARIEAIKKDIVQPCVRITSESGCEVICSIETPITREDGSTYLAINAKNERVYVDGEHGQRWEQVSSVVYEGNRFVTRISVGNISYAAGVDAKRRVITHNSIEKP